MKADIDDLVESCKPTTTAALQSPTDNTVYGTIECYYCKGIKSAKGAKVTTIEVESGRSGGSLSFGGRGSSSNWISSGLLGKGSRSGTGDSIRFNTGRKYYKQVRIYVCSDCVKNEPIRINNETDDVASFALVLFFKFVITAWLVILGIWAIRQL